jgi:hypothetical protein
VSIASYNLAVDFNDDLDYLDAGEDVTARVLPDRGLSCERGKDQLRGIAPPMAGRLDASLDNRSRDYSPENGASPLVGKLVPGHKVRLRATFASVTYDLFTGTLDDLPPHPELGARAVDLPCLGSLSRLKGLKVSTPLYANIRTDQALGYLLDAAGWPTGDRVLSTGWTTLLYWWAEGDAFDAAVTLLNTEGPGASLYEDGSGRIVFEDRHYRLLTTRCTTSQATIRDSGAEPNHTEPFGYNPGLKDIIGSAVVSINARTLGPLGVVWSLGTTLSLAASEARTFPITSGDPFGFVATPTAGLDYAVAAGGVTPSLDRTSGAVVTLTMTAGAGGATITGLQARGQTYSAVSSRVRNSVAGSTIPGAKDYTLAIWPEIHPNQGQDLCNLIVTAYRNPRPTVSLTLEGASATMLTHLLSREVSDRVTVVEAQTGLNAACFVERIARAVDVAGSRHRATLGLEKVSSEAYPPAVVTIDGDAAHGIGSSAVIWY